jgi:hypothetical protein
VPVARAHDSLAPAGAPHTWLPNEDWVHRHWLPFDERQLTARLGLRPRELESYLYNDHRSLAALALARGLDVEALRDELTAPWRGLVDGARYELLRERTQRLLTQPHLAQHAFFHVFHGGVVLHRPETTFGLPLVAVQQLRLGGLTPIEVGRRGGMPASSLRAELLHHLHAEAEEGVRLGFSWPAEAERILARQTARLDCWMRSPRPGGDSANPYGKARFWHGPHVRGWPATMRERRANDRRVERFRRRVAHGCWPIPAPWSGARQRVARP